MHASLLIRKLFTKSIITIAIVLLSLKDEANSAIDAGLPQQDTIDEIVSHVTTAVVAISFENGFDSSGVIISKDGLVLSHCHHTASILFSKSNSVLPRKLPVILHDGKEVEAELLATHRDTTGLVEYSLLRLLGDREWPHADLSTENVPSAGSWCIHFGHPFGWKKSRQPVPRLGRVVLANDGGIASTCLVAPGDSGGPLVDLKGKIIGITTGGRGWKRGDATYHTNATVVRRDPLEIELKSAAFQKEIHTAKIPRLFMTPLRRDSSDSNRIAVQILSGDVVVALGTVVDSNGLIVTKLSELGSKIDILMPDKRVVNGELVARSPEHDLALLRVAASGLGEIQSSAERISHGMLVVSSASLPEESTIGLVGDARIKEVKADDDHSWPELRKSGELSRRRSDFQAIFVHDCAVRPNECGGPVTDTNGRVLGVNIACASRDATYAIPLATILEFVAKSEPASHNETKP